MTPDYGHTNLGKLSIELLPNAQPVRAKSRPLNSFQEADLRRQIENWTKAGVREKHVSLGFSPCSCEEKRVG